MAKTFKEYFKIETLNLHSNITYNPDNCFGIYVHIPYCKKKCHYCNFHFSTNIKTNLEFLKALLREIQLRKDDFPEHKVSSIYFGGGTPSVLTIEEIHEIMETFTKHYTLLPNIEIGIEVNPDDVSLDYLRELKQLQFNRLSIGVQSFFQEDLLWMNRNHTAIQSFKVIEDSINAGFNNFSVDLIYGIPNASHDRWHANLSKLLEFNIPHFSAYALTIEEGTAFHHYINSGKMDALKDQYTIEQMDILLDFCALNQYEAYEISNFAKLGYRAIHNANYWKGFKYLGFGPSAHSYDGIKRYANISNNLLYINQLAINDLNREEESLSYENRFNEFILLNLRKIEGISITEVNIKFPEQLKSTEKLLQKFMLDGLLLKLEENYTLTKSGRYISDYIASQLFI